MSDLFSKFVSDIAKPILYLLMAVAVLYFIWGVFDFIRSSDSPDGRETGFRHMIWGIVGLFIMVSAYGLFNLIKSTIGVN